MHRSNDSLARKALRAAALGALALSLAACCGGKSSVSENGASNGHKAGVIGTGTVNAKKTATNNTGRGIVRSAPNFQAPEVTRLDPGTQVNITATAPGGWYAISWPADSDAQKGFIHGDVMQAHLY